MRTRSKSNSLELSGIIEKTVKTYMDGFELFLWLKNMTTGKQNLTHIDSSLKY